MNIFFKLRFCLILFALNSNTLLAQVTDALIVTPEGNVNVPNGKVQEKGNDLLPKGAIILWYGGTTAPAGWAICDGTQGTPNLSGRFVVAAGSNGETTYKSGDLGGVDNPQIATNQLPSHSHNVVNLKTSTDGSHKHQFYSREYKGDCLIENTVWEMPLYCQANNQTTIHHMLTEPEGAHTHTVSGATEKEGKGESFDNRPKYYALYYIMKL